MFEEVESVSRADPILGLDTRCLQNVHLIIKRGKQRVNEMQAQYKDAGSEFVKAARQ